MCGAALSAQESKLHRGRKYKVPEAASHIEVLVLKDVNSKPLANAAVVFHPVKDGKDEGNLEVKTNEEGKAIIDIIPTGSVVGVQVIADGFATFAGDYKVDTASSDILVRMVRPRAQISVYEEKHGEASQRPIGVQEPTKPSTPPVVQTTKATHHTSDPDPLAPGTVNAPTVNAPTSAPNASTPR